MVHTIGMVLFIYYGIYIVPKLGIQFSSHALVYDKHAFPTFLHICVHVHLYFNMGLRIMDKKMEK